ncbi:VOC family protein [Virgibacillus senegalensis]|uniref:VOC family protein n=1 Tax=Virgibacillus senegalensis TaxID=1499679 RepID=UPI00069F692A|nr:VOC family protein [Virgibacillus senegalensis]
MVKSPIKSKINLVFIPVSDIEKAREWYAKILGIEDGEFHFDHLFEAKMSDGSGLMLDTMPAWRDENGELPTINIPAIQFGTDNIQASYQFMKDNGVNLVTDIQYDQFFVIKDPDGNMMMVCKD